jgi:hypothetical protein
MGGEANIRRGSGVRLTRADQARRWAARTWYIGGLRSTWAQTTAGAGMVEAVRARRREGAGCDGA